MPRAARWAIATLAAALLAAGALLAGASSGSQLVAAAGTDGVPGFGPTFLIVGENTSRSEVTPAEAPYLNGTLKPQSAWLVRYRAFRRSYSLGNYIAMTSGQFTGCEASDGSPRRCHQDVHNIFNQLDSVGRGWIAWSESADNVCDTTDHGSDWAQNPYVAHHQPAVYYDGVEGNRYGTGRRPAVECRQKVLPMGTTAPNDTSALDTALALGQVGDFNLLIPNNCENGHDACGGPAVTRFDNFLSREVPKIEALPAFAIDGDGVLIITWDEGSGSNQVLTVVTGPLVTPGVYTDGPFNHYSLLRTIEDGFGVRHIGGAKTATPITTIWK
jgi:hypothetical protein